MSLSKSHFLISSTSQIQGSGSVTVDHNVRVVSGSISPQTHRDDRKRSYGVFFFGGGLRDPPHPTPNKYLSVLIR